MDTESFRRLCLRKRQFEPTPLDVVANGLRL
jgi:hypothetical protein